MQTLPPPVDQLAGKTLGHYEVKQLLGYGNVNAVYMAQQQPQGQTVMLTAFIIPETFSPQARERFLTRFTQIASTLVRLDHPYILPTFDFGVQFGYPYLITPFVTGGSLARVLRQEGRCAPERVLQLLKQITEGLAYAHQNGIAHGSLKPATILLDDEQNVRITGFGLTTILKMRGIEAIDSQYAHLISIAGAFLGAPEYIAPEVVQGSPADARSDVYSLGVMLFELLTGKLPFYGEDPFLVATQHVQQRVPPLQSLWPDALPGLDLVVQRAVDHDPAQRFQSVSRLANAFERVLTVIQGAKAVKEAAPPIDDLTMPPVVNWDDENFTDVKSSPLTGHMPSVTNPRVEAGNWQLRPPIVTNQLAAIKANRVRENMGQNQSGSHNTAPTASPLLQSPTQEKGQAKKTFDPFSLWTSTSAPKTSTKEPGTFKETTHPPVKKTTKRSAKKTTNSSPRETTNRSVTDTPQGNPTRKSRRRVIAMLATGGVVAAGVVAAGGIGITHFLHQQANTNLPTTSAPTMPKQKINAVTKQGNQVNTAKQATNKKQTPAQQAPQPVHNGTVIGKSNQASNTSQAFKNPADNNASLLVRLPDGTFVAYEQACTHQGVAVIYHPDTHTFICPLHGSIFDPAQNGKVLQGPATTPLPAVKVSVNGDGTITVV